MLAIAPGTLRREILAIATFVLHYSPIGGDWVGDHISARRVERANPR
jgi:hypothetical protein